MTGIGITPAEASLFNVIHFGLTVPPADLCKRAAYPDYSIGSRLTPAENRAALDRCIEKGWLQVIDDAVLGKIEVDIQREGLVGPIYGFPAPGGVDFTEVGAEQWFRVCDLLWDGGHHASFAFCDVVHEKSARFFHAQSHALAERESLREWGCKVEGPSAIGPWRANWWRRFSEGFRLDVENRAQWTGRSSSGGPTMYFPALNVSERLSHAKDVLDRHNVAFAEWLVLAALERTTDSRRIVRMMMATSKRLGEQMSESECLAGLQVCLQNGWLRRVDERLIAEINRLLVADSAHMPVPFNPLDYEGEAVDFSNDGALLYRMMSAEIFGENWEQGLFVEDTYFREEHRYCATKEGLKAVKDEYADSGEIPTSIRTVSIGPWCVYWWERFSTGYRMELTFGKL